MLIFLRILSLPEFRLLGYKRDIAQIWRGSQDQNMMMSCIIQNWNFVCDQNWTNTTGEKRGFRRWGGVARPEAAFEDLGPNEENKCPHRVAGSG
jgi:hypothetical protein